MVMGMRTAPSADIADCCLGAVCAWFAVFEAQRARESLLQKEYFQHQAAAALQLPQLTRTWLASWALCQLLGGGGTGRKCCCIKGLRCNRPGTGVVSSSFSHHSCVTEGCWIGIIVKI